MPPLADPLSLTDVPSPPLPPLAAQACSVLPGCSGFLARTHETEGKALCMPHIQDPRPECSWGSQDNEHGWYNAVWYERDPPPPPPRDRRLGTAAGGAGEEEEEEEGAGGTAAVAVVAPEEEEAAARPTREARVRRAATAEAGEEGTRRRRGLGGPGGGADGTPDDPARAPTRAPLAGGGVDDDGIKRHVLIHLAPLPTAGGDGRALQHGPAANLESRCNATAEAAGGHAVHFFPE